MTVRRLVLATVIVGVLAAPAYAVKTAPKPCDAKCREMMRGAQHCGAKP